MSQINSNGRVLNVDYGQDSSLVHNIPVRSLTPAEVAANQLERVYVDFIDPELDYQLWRDTIGRRLDSKCETQRSKFGFQRCRM
jgi:hypothetical protein